jgi:hypothetical protein
MITFPILDHQVTWQSRVLDYSLIGMLFKKKDVRTKILMPAAA